MNKKKIILAVVIGIILIGSGIGAKYYGTKKQKAEYVSYNEFLTQLESHHVKSITLNRGTDRFVFVDDKGNNHNTDNPKIEDFKEKALLAGVEEFKESSYAWLSELSMLAVYILMFGGMMYIIYGRIGGSDSLDAEKTRPTITFEDVAGMDELKEEFKAMADLTESRKRHPELSVRMPRGILMEGPPGTGKTYLAKAYAGEVKQEFFAINASQVGNVFAGMGANQINHLFKKAKKEAPSVIFIDELDSIGSMRSGGSSDMQRDNTKTLTALLSAMDGFDTDDEVLVIAATNRAEDLDPALIRPGRFDKKFVVAIPDREDRKAMIEYHLKGKKIATDVSLDWLVSETMGHVPADIESMINEAALIAIQRDTDTIDMEMFETAIIQMEIKGKRKKNSRMNPTTRKLTAYHEAGHAVVSFLLCGNAISRVTIIPSTSGVGGYTKSTSDEEPELLSIADLKEQLMTLYAGRESEIIYNDENPDGVTVGCASDIQRATLLIRHYINYFNIDESENALLDFEQFGEAGEKMTLDRARSFAEQVTSQTHTYLREHWELVNGIALELLEKETLYQEDIERIQTELKQNECDVTSYDNNEYNTNKIEE